MDSCGNLPGEMNPLLSDNGESATPVKNQPPKTATNALTSGRKFALS